jgi:hypothetical protein
MAGAIMPLNSDRYTIFKTNVKNLELVNYLAEGIIKCRSNAHIAT